MVKLCFFPVEFRVGLNLWTEGKICPQLVHPAEAEGQKNGQDFQPSQTKRMKGFDYLCKRGHR